MSPSLTDERLRWHLDANQLARERLCQAIFSIDKRFSNIQPRHPRGGPDGGRDLEGMYEDKYIAFGAVGFVNSASDSTEDKRTIKSKFQSDFDRALEENNELKAFVFFTNVNLTISEKSELTESASYRGMLICEIYDRERIRIVLDSPDGLSLRYQYLQIHLSDAEQATFFSRWGDDIQNLISQKFEEFDKRLNRIQFIQESANPLRNISFQIELYREYSINQLPHYRALISISSWSDRSPFKHMHFASCDNSERGTTKEEYVKAGGLAGAFWEKDSSKIMMTSKSVRNEKFRYIVTSGGYSEFDYMDQTPILKDLDECMFGFFVSKDLSRKIKSIKIHANEYRVWHAPIDFLTIDEPNGGIDTPWYFTDDELLDEWVRIMPSSGVGRFVFSDVTPVRFFDAQEL